MCKYCRGRRLVFTLMRYTNKCTLVKCALTYTVDHLYVSVAFATIIRVLHRNSDKIIIIISIGIQPLGRFGQRPELSQVTGVVLVLCILGKFLGVVCHCFPPLIKYKLPYCLNKTTSCYSDYLKCSVWL